MVLPLVKDLLAGLYDKNNGSDSGSVKKSQTLPTLTLFLEQVAQRGDKVRSTFKLTVGPNKVLAGEEEPPKPVKAVISSISPTRCDDSSVMEEAETDSPILGPAKANSPNLSNMGGEPVNPIPNLSSSTSSTCCENTMEQTEVDSPVLFQAQHSSVSKVVEPNLLFSSPNKTLSSQNGAQEISAIFMQDESTILPSCDSITDTSAITSPSFLGLSSQPIIDFNR